MNSRLLTLVILHSALLISQAAPPPELATLRQQYEKAFVAPFEEAMTALTAKYSAGLDRGMTEAKAAGDLKAVLALESEKKRLTEKLPIPDEEDAATPAALQRLRSIYREQTGRLHEARAARQSSILAAYSIKLQELEVALTKADRVAEAAEVLAYRESLLAGSPQPPPVPPGMAVKSADTPAAVPPVDAGLRVSEEEASRQIVEWAVQNGHDATVLVGGKILVIKTVAEIPKEKHRLLKLDSRSTASSPPPWRLFQFIESVDRLFLGLHNHDVSPQEMALLGRLRNLKHLEFKSRLSEPDACLQALPEFPKLTSLIFTSPMPARHIATLVRKYPALKMTAFDTVTAVTDEEFAVIKGWKNLVELRMDALRAPFSAGMVDTLNSMPGVTRLVIFGPRIAGITPEQAARLKHIKDVSLHYNNNDTLPGILHISGLKSLMIRNIPGLHDEHLNHLAQAPAHLESLHLEGLPKMSDAILGSILSAHGGLQTLRLVDCSALTPGGLESLSGLKELQALNLTRTPAATDAALSVLQELKKLRDLSVKDTAITAAAINDFQKKRPEIRLAR